MHLAFPVWKLLKINTKQQSTQGKHGSQNITSFTFQVDWNSDDVTFTYFNVFCIYILLSDTLIGLKKTDF